ncbi:hypothetical protein FG379_001582 [Cryptosporidium bovis]|uniref:uncharacterized protein n=1 Tax=Cryptosporidium bovis TaxID=310047 RepID=UPI00351A70CB|nr:hypothetical protein FG379_001582 [Cryptosporidium bovis]
MNANLEDILNDNNIKANVNLIPISPLSKPIIFVKDDIINIQINEIIAINAIYGHVKLHHISERLSKIDVENIESQIINSISDENILCIENDDVEIRTLFVPVESDYDNCEAENVDLKNHLRVYNNIIYSLVLSRNISEALPFKNRRYWRRNNIYGRLTVYYNSEYPLENPCLLFEFSLELPDNIYNKFIQQVKEVIVNRSGDQECIFQVINIMESTLDDLYNYLQISEDLWEQMRRINNQKELEKYYDKISVIGSTVGNDGGFEDNEIVNKNVNNIDNIGFNKLLDDSVDDRFSSSYITKADYSFKRNELGMTSGFLDDTIIEYANDNINNSNINNGDHSNSVNFHDNKDNSNIFLSSKRLNQDFIVVEVIYSDDNVVITKSLHLIDQNNYQVSIYRIPSSKYNLHYKNIISNYSSLIMSQHKLMARYYQCWVEENVDKDNHDIYIYIQSEYMNGITLYEYLKKNIKKSEYYIIWSFFRQILEVISYCHHNGVYHMSLSSKCIHLEEDVYGYSIKLSDFVFGNHLDLLNNNGNNNNDINCIGKILCEMWIKIKYKEKNNNYNIMFNTLCNWLENVQIKEDVDLVNNTNKNTEDMFNFTQDIPFEFKYIPKSVLLILKKLLYEGLKIEYIDELLKSDLIPSSINKHEFSYYLSRICNSRTHESSMTINTLFNRCIDKMNSLMFLLDIKEEEKINIMNSTFSDIVKTIITNILNNHDFTIWKLPELFPVKLFIDNVLVPNKKFDDVLYECKFRLKKPYYLIDKSNNLLILSNSIPFSVKCSILSLLTNYNEINFVNLNNYYSSSSLSTEVDSTTIGSGATIATLSMSTTHLNKEKASTVILNNKNDMNNSCYTNYSAVSKDKDNLISGINLDFPVQRYFLQPIYEQSTNVNGKQFGPPKSSLSLSYDIIYTLNNNCTNKTLDDLYTKVIDNIMIELEGLLLSLRIVLPWLNFLEEDPILTITYFPLVKVVLMEITNDNLNSFNIDVSKIRMMLVSNELIHYNNKIILKNDEYLKDLLLNKYEIEWEYDHKVNNYKLQKFNDNDFTKKLIKKGVDIYSKNHSGIGMYINVINEIINVLSDSIDLLICNNKKIKIYFDPLMDYDYNVYDNNCLLYTIHSSNNIIYSMGGSNTFKINHLMEVNKNNNTPDSHMYGMVNSVMGEIAIELIIQKVCDKAKRYRNDIIDSGGYINIISSEQSFNAKNGEKNDKVCLNTLKAQKERISIHPIYLLRFCYPRIIVMTQKNKLQPKVLGLTKKLWQMGIRSEYRLTPVQSLSIFLEKLKRDTLIELLIIVMNPNKVTPNYNDNCNLNEGEREAGTSGFDHSKTFSDLNLYNNNANNYINYIDNNSNSTCIGVGAVASSNSNNSSNIIVYNNSVGNSNSNCVGNASIGVTANLNSTNFTSNSINNNNDTNGIFNSNYTNNNFDVGNNILYAGINCISEGECYILNNNTSDNNVDNICVNYRIEHICRFNYDSVLHSSLENTKIIMENEDSVINYVISRKKKTD